MDNIMTMGNDIMPWDIQTFGEVRVGLFLVQPFGYDHAWRSTQEQTLHKLARNTDWIVLRGSRPIFASDDQILHSKHLKVRRAFQLQDNSTDFLAMQANLGRVNVLQGRAPLPLYHNWRNDLRVQDDKCPKCRQEVPAFVPFLL